MGEIFEVTTDVKPAEVINIPAAVALPDLRYAAPSGTFAQGDIITGSFTLNDSSGNEKPLGFDGFKITLKDWPTPRDGTNQEILGCLYVNFAVSDVPKIESTKV